MDLSPYIVRQGDYLTRLAFTFGFDVDAVWNDPKNEDLRKQRGNHNILAPGDILYIPMGQKMDGLPLTVGSGNSYVATVPKVKKTIRFTTSQGPLANARFTADGAQPQEGTSDGEGRVELQVPVTTGEVHVVFTDKDLSFSIRLGHMDPVTETSGVRSRLRNLGYLLPHPFEFFNYPEVLGLSPEFDEDERLQGAVSAFQVALGLPQSGTMDDATRDALVKAHGG